MDLAAAALCIGFASLMKFSSSSKKMTCELLRRAISVNDLKGLGEVLGNNKIENPTVVVHGTVGSTSTVENSRLGVFIEETHQASLKFKKMDHFGSLVPKSSCTIIEKTASLEFEKMDHFGPEELKSKTIFVSRKEVPWYLEDGTARVDVLDYRYATGFYGTLKTYFSTEPVITYIKSPVSDEKKKSTDIDGNKCSHALEVTITKEEKVLEIGTYLTVVGRAMRDNDGAPTIRNAYQFFSGHIQLNKLVTDLESESESCESLSFCLTVLGAILLGLNIMQTAVERSR